MKANDKKYIQEVFENNFEIGLDDSQIDEQTYEVDKFYDARGIVFLSEWFFDENVHRYTGIEENFFEKKRKIPTQYCFPDSTQTLNKRIQNFHKKEGFYEEGSEIFITEGSTPMIASMVLFAKYLGFPEIYSVSPLYFNIFKIADLIDIPVRPINTDLTFRDDNINLPLKKSILFLTDPIWSIGRHHSEKIFKKIRKWQKSTKSLVFIDGSFSYTDWYTKDKRSPGRILDPALTFRLICPTKTLCLNGLRFSYLICPSKYRKEISQITSSSIGSSCYLGHLYREEMFEKMTKKEINPIGRFSRERFLQIEKLLEEKNIEYIKPDCGFFMFANLSEYLEKNAPGKYMWLPVVGLDIPNKKYKNFVKLNLMMREKSFKQFVFDLSK